MLFFSPTPFIYFFYYYSLSLFWTLLTPTPSPLPRLFRKQTPGHGRHLFAQMFFFLLHSSFNEYSERQINTDRRAAKRRKRTRRWRRRWGRDDDGVWTVEGQRKRRRRRTTTVSSWKSWSENHTLWRSTATACLCFHQLKSHVKKKKHKKKKEEKTAERKRRCKRTLTNNLPEIIIIGIYWNH